MRATEAMIRAAAVTGAAAHAVAVGVGVSGSAHLGTTLPMLLASLVCVGCVLWRTPVMVAGLAVGAMVVLHLWLGPDYGHGQPTSRSDPLPTLAGLFMEVGVLAAPAQGGLLCILEVRRRITRQDDRIPDQAVSVRERSRRR